MFRQQKRYVAEVNRAAEVSTGSTDVLLTGRGKGAFQGAVAVLIFDRATNQIKYSRLMRGASVFAKFKDAPELLGDLESVKANLNSKSVLKALESAIDNLPPVSYTAEEKAQMVRHAREAKQAKNNDL